jgi:hypothetical protein
LQYAAGGRRKRRWVRRALAALVVLGTATGATYFRKPIWAQARLLYWQRQCMNYEEPPGHVAYLQVGGEIPATDRAELTALGQHPGYAPYGDLTVKYDPGCLDYFDQFSSLEAYGPFSLNYREPCLFLHQCRSPRGNDRLVGVAFEFDAMKSHGMLEVYQLSSVAIRPATVFTKPELIWTYGSRQNITYSTFGTPRLIRFFTGRPDPADRSHFTIDYEAGDIRALSSDPALTARGTIDGAVVVPLLLRNPADAVVAGIVKRRLPATLHRKPACTREVGVAQVVLPPGGIRLPQVLRPPPLRRGHRLHGFHRFHWFHRFHSRERSSFRQRQER